MSLSLERLEAISSCALGCGSVRDAYEFCVYAFKGVRKLVPYDQGRIYFLDEQGKVFDEYLVDVRKELTRAYHELYADVDSGAYSVTRKSSNRRSQIKARGQDSAYALRAIDWESEPHNTRFYREYLVRLGIRYSTGFNLYDLEDHVRALFVLDRRPSSGMFSEEEMEVLSLLNQHLDNLYRNFYVTPPATLGDTIALDQSGAGLTQRERDIAKLMLVGLSPKRVAEKLGISRATVYKHVANVHAKLGVKSQLELINKLRTLTLE